MATPPKAELKDYLWCVQCAAYVPKKLLRRAEGVLFRDESSLTCPDGHTELQDMTEGANDPPKPS